MTNFFCSDLLITWLYKPTIIWYCSIEIIIQQEWNHPKNLQQTIVCLWIMPSEIGVTAVLWVGLLSWLVKLWVTACGRRRLSSFWSCVVTCAPTRSVVNATFLPRTTPTRSWRTWTTLKFSSSLTTYPCRVTADCRTTQSYVDLADDVIVRPVSTVEYTSVADVFHDRQWSD